MKVSLTMHSFPAKRQGWGADEMRIDLASKAADFICGTLYCQGGMFYAGRILFQDRKRASLVVAETRACVTRHANSLTNQFVGTPQHVLHENLQFWSGQPKFRSQKSLSRHKLFIGVFWLVISLQGRILLRLFQS